MIIPFMVGIFHNIAGTTVGWFFCLFLQASWLPAVTVWNSCLRFLHSLFCHSCLWLSGNKSYHSVWHDCSSPELYSFDRHSDLLQTDLLLLESLLMLIWPQRLVIIKCQPFAYLHTSILEYCVITCHRWICLNASVIVHLINHFFNFHSSLPNLTKDLKFSWLYNLEWTASWHKTWLCCIWKLTFLHSLSIPCSVATAHYHHHHHHYYYYLDHLEWVLSYSFAHTASVIDSTL